MVLTYMAVTLVAILWLLYRLFQFLNIPVWKIVSTLDIQIPHATKISIDNITRHTLTIRWENQPSIPGSSSPISHYLLYLNNEKIGIFPNTSTSLYTCCSLDNLKPQTQYQLDFITVNKHGFTNKVPSIYLMTRAEAEKVTASNLYDTEEDSSPPPLLQQQQQQQQQQLQQEQQQQQQQQQIAPLYAPNFPTDAKWRKPSMIVDSSSPTSYASLTSLQDLEHFSITDLKKILICAQEDLHDVLQQQFSVLQDFRETELQLQLELDNLKTQWSHDIDLRKSLKSSIKSLENSKLLYDLKREKIEKNFKQVKSKIEKMNKDMERWETEEKDELIKEKLQENCAQKKAAIVSQIESIKAKNNLLQNELSSHEEKNKKLNTLKKSLDTTSKRDTDTALPSLSVALKKINDFTLDKSGLLNNAGEEFLNKLPEASPVTPMVREQLNIDSDLENKWRSKKIKFRKRLEVLERMWTEISASNRQLRASLTAQPYASNNASQELHNENVNAPQLVLHDPTTYKDTGSGEQQQQTSLLAQTVAANPYVTTSNATATATRNDTQLETWGKQQHNAVYPDDQNYEYEDANHLLTGLQSMISEVDYQDNNISTSKLFTNDQLDNYWNNSDSNVRVNRTDDTRISSLGSSTSSPSSSPVLPQQQKASQSLLAILNESDTPMTLSDSMYTDRSSGTGNGITTSNSGNEDVISFNSALQTGPASSPLPIQRKQEINDGGFHSPNFNSIWSNSNISNTSTYTGASPPQLETPKQQHNRNDSVNWGLSNFLHHSPATASLTSIPTVEEQKPTVSNTDMKAKQESNLTTKATSHKESQSTNGLKVPKLLSKNGMNHLFRLPSHDK